VLGVAWCDAHEAAEFDPKGFVRRLSITASVAHRGKVHVRPITMAIPRAIALALFLGLATTVAVAWGLAAWLPQKGGSNGT
jgi:hypothetical protein